MQSSMQHSGNKIGKSTVWSNNSLAKTVAALDEFKSGFPSNGLITVSNKWWGSSTTEDQTEKNTEEHTNGDEDEAVLEKQDSLVAIRKRIAKEGREALRKGFTSKTADKKDQALLFHIFKNKDLC